MHLRDQRTGGGNLRQSTYMLVHQSHFTHLLASLVSQTHLGDNRAWCCLLAEMHNQNHCRAPRRVMCTTRQASSAAQLLTFTRCRRMRSPQRFTRGSVSRAPNMMRSMPSAKSADSSVDGSSSTRFITQSTAAHRYAFLQCGCNIRNSGISSIKMSSSTRFITQPAAPKWQASRHCAAEVLMIPDACHAS